MAESPPYSQAVEPADRPPAPQLLANAGEGGLQFVSATGTKTDDFVRAPTLMAGEAPGSQGAVRVWSPEKRLIRLKVASLGAAAAACVSLHLLLNSSALWLWLVTMLPLPVLLAVGLAMATAIAFLVRYVWSTLAALPALRRPCFLTTDDAGIGITTWSGSQALRWEEVTACARYDRYCTVFLYRNSGRAAMINITGYPSAVVDDLCALAAERAQLTVNERSWWRRLLFWGGYACRLRTGYRLAYPDSVVPDAPALPSAPAAPAATTPAVSGPPER